MEGKARIYDGKSTRDKFNLGNMGGMAGHRGARKIFSSITELQTACDMIRPHVGARRPKGRRDYTSCSQSQTLIEEAGFCRSILKAGRYFKKIGRREWKGGGRKLLSTAREKKRRLASG